MLQSFSARFDTYSGNFKVDLKFYTYKYTVLNEITMGYALAVPHMYKSRIKITPIQDPQSSNKTVVDTTTSIGFMKIKEMYSEYKSKGLIPDNFPEITIVQMSERIDNFVKNEFFIVGLIIIFLKKLLIYLSGEVFNLIIIFALKNNEIIVAKTFA